MVVGLSVTLKNRRTRYIYRRCRDRFSFILYSILISDGVHATFSG